MAKISLSKRRKRTSEEDQRFHAFFRKLIGGLVGLVALALVSDYSSEIFGSRSGSGSKTTTNNNNSNNQQRYLSQQQQQSASRNNAIVPDDASFATGEPTLLTTQAVVPFSSDSSGWRQTTCPCAEAAAALHHPPGQDRRRRRINGVPQVCQCPLQRFQTLTALDDLQLSLTFLPPGESWDLSASRHARAVPYRPEQNYEQLLVVLRGRAEWTTTYWKLGMPVSNVTRQAVGPHDVLYYDNYHPRQNIQTSVVTAAATTTNTEPVQILSLRYSGKKRVTEPLSEADKKRNINANLLFPDVKTNHYEIKPHPKTGRDRRVDKQHVPKRPTRTLESLNIHSTLYSNDPTLGGVAETPPHTDAYDVVHVVLDGQVTRNPQGDVISGGSALVMAGRYPHGLQLAAATSQQSSSSHVVFEFHCDSDACRQSKGGDEAAAAVKK